MAIAGSDIAKYVLEYLRDQHLDEAYVAFCKTSPYLREEYDFHTRGLRVMKLHDNTLMDILSEYSELKSTLNYFIESLPAPTAHTLRWQRTYVKKLEMIMKAIDSTKLKKLKRRYSIECDSKFTSIDTSQPNDLFGYHVLPAKRQRLANDFILPNETTPSVPKTVNTYAISTIEKPAENDSSGSAEEVQPHYTTISVLSETILENKDFQDVLVANINQMFASPDKQLQFYSVNVDNTAGQSAASDQIENAIKDVIDATTQHPTFDDIVNECLQNSVEYRRSTAQRISSTPHKENEAEVENSDSEASIPLKRRLRKRKPSSRNVTTAMKRSNQKPHKPHKPLKDINIISNEPFIGKLPTAIEAIQGNQQLLPVSSQQLLIINSNGSITTQPAEHQPQLSIPTTFLGNENPTINLNQPTNLVPDDQTIVYNVVYNNTGEIVSMEKSNNDMLKPGSIINIMNATNISASHPSNSVTLTNLKSDQPCIDGSMETVVTVNNTKCTISSSAGEKFNEESLTPRQLLQLNPLKEKSLSTPRRNSHIRVLNFNTPGIPISDQHQRVFDFIKKRNEVSAEIANNKQSSSSPGHQIETSPKLSQNASSEQSAAENVIQESSDGVDFGRDIDEDTVVSVDLTQPYTPINAPNLDTNKNFGKIKQSPPKSRKKSAPKATGVKPSKIIKTEVKSPKKSIKSKIPNNLEEWVKLRSIKPSDWDNHLRAQTSTSTFKPVARRIRKKRKTRSSHNNSMDKSDQSNSPDTSLDFHANQLEEALKSARKVSNNADTTSDHVGERKPIEDTSLAHQPTSVIDLSTADDDTLCNRNSKIKIKVTPAKSTCKSNLPKKKDIFPTKKAQPSMEKPDEKLSNQSINLGILLDTPFKVDLTEAVPPTPRITMPFANLDTPVVKFVRVNNSPTSLIKFTEFPTPNFAVTPGAIKTPASVHSSSRSVTYMNRLTDYSSGSSYYRPDETDELDKNLGLVSGSIESVSASIDETHLSSEAPNVTNVCKNTKNSCNYVSDQLEEGELDNTSSSNSTSSDSPSSSSTSRSSSSCSDENKDLRSSYIDIAVINEIRNDKLEIARRCATKQPVPVDPVLVEPTLQEKRERQQKEMEMIRKRTVARLKKDCANEKFKPKLPLAHRKGQLARKQGLAAAAAAAVSQHPPTVNTIKLSEPKLSQPNILTQTKQMPQTKRKTTTPRKLIILSPSSSRINNMLPTKPIYAEIRPIGAGSHKKVDRIFSQNLSSATERVPILQEQQKFESSTKRGFDSHSHEDIINNDKSKDNVNKSVESTSFNANGKAGITVLPPDIQKSLNSAEENKLDAITKAELAQNLFGDGIMSDSDFIDTPVKSYRYDERNSDVLPALSLMPTPSSIRKKVSEHIALVKSESHIEQTKSSQTNQNEIIKTCTVQSVPTNKIPQKETLGTPSSSQSCSSLLSKTTQAPSVVQAKEIMLPSESVSICPVTKSNDPILPFRDSISNASAPKELKVIPKNSSDCANVSDEDMDPYDENTLLLAYENRLNCLFEVIESKTNNKPLKHFITPKYNFPPTNIVFDGLKVRINVTKDIDLFSFTPETNTKKSKPQTISSNKSNITYDSNKSKYKTLATINNHKEPVNVNERNVSSISSSQHCIVPPESNVTDAVEPGSNILVPKLKVTYKVKGEATTKDIKTFSNIPVKTATHTDVQAPLVQKLPAVPTPKISDMDINMVLDKIHPSVSENRKQS